jgi:protein ImuA
MAGNAAARAELRRLRRNIAEIEGRLAEEGQMALPPTGAGFPAVGAITDLETRKRNRLAFGIPRLDRILGGGLPLARLHEIRASESRDGGAAGGFIAALVARLTATDFVPSTLWISEADTRREAGRLYAPGLAALGLNPASIVEVAVRTETEALWAFEAALSCHALHVAICELRQASLDLSATRRCALRARERGVTGFLLRLGNSSAEPSAAELRFRISPMPAAAIGGFSAGVGRMAWRLVLEKNRLGPTGVFSVEWNAHERSFAERRREWADGRFRTDPQPLPASSSDRSAHPSKTEGRGVLRRAS